MAATRNVTLKYLPEAPCSILDISLDPGARCEAQKKAGIHVTCLHSDAMSIMSRLETMRSKGHRFDMVLFHDTARHMNVLELFYLSAGVLKEQAYILIQDDVDLHSAKAKEVDSHWLENILSVAKRCGFEWVNLDSTAVGDTPESGDGVLKFQQSTIPRWQLELVGSRHIGELGQLFQSVFHETMTAELWQWKYGEGRGEAVIARKGGQLVSHYGGVSRDAMFFGKRCTVCQNGDVMVAVSERGALTRKGPFFLTCATYLELFIGYEKKYLLGYGFPNRRAMKVAERLGLYEEVDTMSEIRWPAGNRWPALKTRIRNIDPVLDQDMVQSLWLEMSHDLSGFIVGARDFSYIRHRYLDHPEKEYHILLVSRRLGGSPCGLIVLRCLDDACELMDVVGSLEHIPLLVDQARRVARRWGKKSVFCWVSTPPSSIFKQSDGVITDLDISIPCNVWSDGPRQQELRGRWWLMSGDTDFR